MRPIQETRHRLSEVRFYRRYLGLAVSPKRMHQSPGKTKFSTTLGSDPAIESFPAGVIRTVANPASLFRSSSRNSVALVALKSSLTEKTRIVSNSFSSDLQLAYLRKSSQCNPDCGRTDLKTETHTKQKWNSATLWIHRTLLDKKVAL